MGDLAILHRCAKGDGVAAINGYGDHRTPHMEDLRERGLLWLVKLAPGAIFYQLSTAGRAALREREGE